ncbi:Uncharacterized [Syntrophomonas zehnderi OL-4]|uniref:Uncharacterized n=1 Tax=Syntrophomonas zehnderi OL-4 TaxID=690567 RepID=A0A0E3W2X2_9FIRM|nr:hypothetical protein [Syntrophomonas zehnderi]CFX28420.1 Uncharacterized [Syntrophomonas zehnderi OL-4]
MKKLGFLTKLGALFIVLSLTIYSIHYAIFSDAPFIFRYFIAQLGFLPINVLLVTIVFNSLMTNRAKNERLIKMNMVIGAFFSEVGTELLKTLTCHYFTPETFGQQLLLSDSWEQADFANAKNLLKNSHLSQIDPASLQDMNSFLIAKRDFLLRLLENPNLLEHESFTNLLWAVFHLSDELGQRNDLASLSNSDYAHLREDVKRVYLSLANQWLDYMQHLKANYPYLFSLGVRTNPFNPQAEVEVR